MLHFLVAFSLSLYSGLLHVSISGSLLSPYVAVALLNGHQMASTSFKL